MLGLSTWHWANSYKHIPDYTLRKVMSANDKGIVAVTGRAHCQRQELCIFLNENENAFNKNPKYTW